MCTAFVQEWALQVAEKYLQQEEEKEERFFPLNFRTSEKVAYVAFSS